MRKILHKPNLPGSHNQTQTRKKDWRTETMGSWSCSHGSPSSCSFIFSSWSWLISLRFHKNTNYELSFVTMSRSNCYLCFYTISDVPVTTSCSFLFHHEMLWTCSNMQSLFTDLSLNTRHEWEPVKKPLSHTYTTNTPAYSVNFL